MKKIFLKKNEEIRIKNGHLWVFSNEIDKTEENPENGDIVQVYDYKNNCVGSAFYNKNSLISLRIISREEIGDYFALLRKRILDSYRLRTALYPHRKSFRIVFGESDFLPGLIIDKYNGTFVLQVNSFGMEKNINAVIKILKEDLSAENIFSRNDLFFRKLEGLPESDKVYYGSIKTEIINDGSVSYQIDFTKAQKTGFFFDQSDNRFFVENIAKDREVLDAFCNSGGFGLHAASANAASVTFVDSSAHEIEAAESNFKLNGFKIPAAFIKEDVFDFFEDNSRKDNLFDVVIIDPPAFAKNRKIIKTAIKGYERLNKLALMNLKKEGFLASSSCSYHVNEDQFLNIVRSAALKSGRDIQLIYFNNASMDHPRLPAMEETNYLKFAVFRVI